MQPPPGLARNRHERATRAIDRLPPAVWPLVSVTGISLGFALAKNLFDQAGPGGLAALRLGFAAVLLLPCSRPRLPSNRRTLALIVAWGTAQAGATTFVFYALNHLPLGVTVTLEFLGPLTVALIESHRARDLVWIALAGLGVVLLSAPGAKAVDLAGLVLALAGGACWGAHIVLAGKAGDRTRGASGLALALAWAAILTVPAGIIDTGPATLASPLLLLGGLGVAVASTLVPYSADLKGRRRIPARAFGVLVSLEPAVAALVGLALLGESLAARQWAGIGCVVAASIAVSRQPSRARQASSSTASR